MSSCIALSTGEALSDTCIFIQNAIMLNIKYCYYYYHVHTILIWWSCLVILRGMGWCLSLSSNPSTGNILVTLLVPPSPYYVHHQVLNLIFEWLTSPFASCHFHDYHLSLWCHQLGSRLLFKLSSLSFSCYFHPSPIHCLPWSQSDLIKVQICSHYTTAQNSSVAFHCP